MDTDSVLITSAMPPANIVYPTSKDEMNGIIQKHVTLTVDDLVGRLNTIRQTWGGDFDGKLVSFSRSGTFIITANDDVYGMGDNSKAANILGLTGRHYRCERAETFVKVDKLCRKRVQVICSGKFIGGALDDEGRLYWWGQDPMVDENILLPQLASDELKFKMMSCGCRMIAALDHSGRVYIWGRYSRKGSPHIMEHLEVEETIKDLSCGRHHLAMLSNTGNVFTWGNGYSGQRGVSCMSDYPRNENEFNVVHKVSLNHPCKVVSCGPESTLCWTTAGEIWACGQNCTGVGVPYVPNETVETYLPKKVNLRGNVIFFSAFWMRDDAYYYALTTEGYCSWYGSGMDRLEPEKTLVDELTRLNWVFPHDLMCPIDVSKSSPPKLVVPCDKEEEILANLSNKFFLKCKQIEMNLQSVGKDLNLIRNFYLCDR